MYLLSACTLFVGGLLTNMLPLISHAQTVPASSRLYIGAEANLLTNVPFKDYGIVPKLLGPALTAGIQLTPRLAVQAGVSYQWEKDSFVRPYPDASGTGTVTSSLVSHAKYFIVPVLLRYTVTTPTEHLHLDALGGVTLVHATLHTTSDISFPVNPYHEESASADTRLSLTLGPAVRYSVSPHIELTASSLVSANLGENYDQFSDRLFLNVAVGAHYTFGQPL